MVGAGLAIRLAVREGKRFIQGVTADRPGEEKTFKCYELDVTLKLVEDEGEIDAPNPAIQPSRLSVALRARPMSDLRQGLRNCDTLII